jgi:hypothetical protein
LLSKSSRITARKEGKVMEDRRSTFAARRSGWLLAVALTVMLGLGLAAGALTRSAAKPDVWTVLVETGDALAAGELTATLGGQPLTPAKAYLLAFHEAQDAGDLEHVLAMADRLDAVHEPDLATHVRLAAQVLLEEIGR